MTFERHTFTLPLLTISPYLSPPLAHRLLTTSCSPSIPTHCLPFSHSPHTHHRLLLTISSCSPFPPVHCLPLLTTFSYLPSLPANHLPLLPLLTPLSLTHHLPPCSLSSPLLTPPAAQHLPLLTPSPLLTTSPCSPPPAHPPLPYSPPPPAHHLPLLTPLSLTHHLLLLTTSRCPPTHHLLLHGLVDVGVVAGEQLLHELEVLWTELVLLVHEQHVLPPHAPLDRQWHFDLGGCRVNCNANPQGSMRAEKGIFCCCCFGGGGGSATAVAVVKNGGKSK